MSKQFTATCHTHPTPFTTTDARELEAHLTKDGRKPRPWYGHTYADVGGMTPQWVRSAGKPWRVRFSRTPFTPKPFEPGDVITWVEIDHTVETVRTGQVWSGHPAPKTRWVVADGKPYAVHESDLVDAWLASQYAAHHRVCRSRGGYGYGENWQDRARLIRLSIRRVEAQLNRPIEEMLKVA